MFEWILTVRIRIGLHSSHETSTLSKEENLTYHQDDIGCQQATHGVTNKDCIGPIIFVRLKPLAKVVSCQVDGLVCLVPISWSGE